MTMMRSARSMVLNLCAMMTTVRPFRLAYIARWTFQQLQYSTYSHGACYVTSSSHNKSNNNNNHGAVNMVKPLWEFTTFIWWMTEQWATANPQTKPTDLNHESASKGCYHPRPPLPLIIITQPKSQYSSYHPMENEKLSWLMHCIKCAAFAQGYISYCKSSNISQALNTKWVSNRSQASNIGHALNISLVSNTNQRSEHFVLTEAGSQIQTRSQIPRPNLLACRVCTKYGTNHNLAEYEYEFV